MKNNITFIAFAALMALFGCGQNRDEAKHSAFDWDNNDKIEYTIDYKVRFSADHDSTMLLTAESNYGTINVVSVESENLIGTDGKLVKNTFIILEDSIPMSKSIILQRGGLSYSGENLGYIHNQVVGSDDMVEIRTLDSDNYTMYSIRDNMFFGPNDEQGFTIGEGQRFSVVLPVMTKQQYPKEEEIHTIKIDFDIISGKTE